MKLIIEGTDWQKEKRVEIEAKGDEFNIFEVMQELVEPALKAWGYSEQTVKSIYGDDDE